MARDETGRAKARKLKLEEAIKIAGSAAKLSKLCGISASEISQMRNPDHPRNVGDVAAEKIEIALSLPHGWMDRLDDEESQERININALLNVATPTYMDALIKIQQAQDAGVLEESDKAMLKIIAEKYKSIIK